MMITPRGRFKGEVDARWHCIPIADKTKSRIAFPLWLERVLHQQVNLKGRSAGWLFVDKKGGRAKFGAYDQGFRRLLAEAPDCQPRLLPAAVETEDFSLWRLHPMGVMLETTNQDVSKKVIDHVNHSRKKEGANGSEPGMPMR